MKIPSKCPCCGGPLLNEYYELGAERTSYLRQTCKCKVDHQIRFSSLQGKDDEVAMIIIYIKPDRPLIRAVWDLQRTQLTIIKDGRVEDNTVQKYMDIPFFEPDLSDYNKLLNKLKTYTLFA